MGRKAHEKKKDCGQNAEADAGRMAAKLLETVNQSANPALALLRSKYALLDKAEWWWLFDDSLEEIGKCLSHDNFVIVDGFVPAESVQACRDEIEGARQRGLLELGGLAGGNAGRATSYSLNAVRGDLMQWFNGDEPHLGWSAIPAYLKKADTFVSELSKAVPELRSIQNRSKVMTTVYPGGDARYIRHVDNSNRNGRKLTVILYLNTDWAPSHGGALRIYRCLGEGPGSRSGSGFTDCDGNSLEDLPTPPEEFPEKDRNKVAAGFAERGTARVEKPGAEGAMPVALTDVAPLAGRLLAFFSDTRVPHEVLPAHTDRYALTVWYYAQEELVAARAAPPEVQAGGALEEKIAKEIAEMQAKYGGVATVVKKGPSEAGGAGSDTCGGDAAAEEQPPSASSSRSGEAAAAALPSAAAGAAAPSTGLPHTVGAWAPVSTDADAAASAGAPGQQQQQHRWQVQVLVPLAGHQSAAGMRLDLDPVRGLLELAEDGADAEPTRIRLPALPGDIAGTAPAAAAATEDGTDAVGSMLCGLLEAATVSARFVKKRAELVVTVGVALPPPRPAG